MDVNKYFPKLIRAALDNDEKAVRSISLSLIRKFKISDQTIANEIVKALDYNAIGSLAKRSLGIDDSPIDADSKNNLLNVEEPFKVDRPIYNEKINRFIDDFLSERKHVNKLLEAGIVPTSSLLLYGPPGVGKTCLAKYLAGELNIKFAVLNLATVISSYLGKTGQNIKSVLDYARNEPTVLLLDEFDSVAKKRDDYSDLGELKRIVNVLLKELEDWPYNSVVIAATNYPELLDNAIWRRFDGTLEIGLPEQEERLQILLKQTQSVDIKDKIKFLRTVSALLDGFSADGICKMVDRVKRQYIINGGDIEKIFINELGKNSKLDSVSFRKIFCKVAKENTNMSLAELGNLLGKSKSAVQYYLR